MSGTLIFALPIAACSEVSYLTKLNRPLHKSTAPSLSALLQNASVTCKVQ